jgi:16S rRNA processing protein RimM
LTERPLTDGVLNDGVLNDGVVVGRVGKPHGLDGSFVVDDASEDAHWFARGARLHVNGAVAEVVASKHGGGGRPVIRLDVKPARGSRLEVERSALPPTGDDEYYIFQLVGLSVVEETGRVLGTVATVTPGVANDVLELDAGLALPMVEECIREVDLAGGRILVAAGFSDSLD